MEEHVRSVMEGQASEMHIDRPPPMIMQNLEGQKMPITSSIEVNSDGENIYSYRLCGVIYFGDFHFTSRIIDRKGNIWYYDGAQETSLQGCLEGTLDELDRNNLLFCKGRKAAMVLYIIDKITNLDSE